MTDLDNKDVDEPLFSVRVSKMIESHRETWWVFITNNKLRPIGTSFLDSVGQMTPFMSEKEEEAIHVGSEYAIFLGYPDQVVCNCIMCRPRKKR